jgi:hypothetical protein
MMKKIILGIFMFMAITGCSRCLLVHSEYYDITGSVLTPKSEDVPIEIYAEGQEVGRPYFEIGSVKVMAQHGTSKEAFNKELIKRARAAGADAIIDIQYIEDKGNDMPLCGKLLSTKRNMTATGKTVVFTPLAGQIDKK